MTTTIASTVIQNEMATVLRNPKASVRLSLDLLEKLTDGEVIAVDASNPFVYALEMGAIATNVGLVQSEALANRLYPSMAKTQEDMYLHMADADYIGRFATPGVGVVGFVMPFEDLLGKSVPLNDGSGARGLIIPRHTSVTIGTYTLTLLYPIVIKVLYNNTLNIYMDLTSANPVYKPSTNIIKWQVAVQDTVKWIVLDVPAPQVKIASHIIQITSYTGYSKQFSFEDEFCHARAFIRNTSGQWVEIHTTHQEQVYNPNQPTVCLKVLNRTLDVYIPQIYFRNGGIAGNLRVDIYTTRGVVSEDLTTFDAASPKIKLLDLDMPLTNYSTPLNKFTALMAIPRTTIEGGSAPITFTELLNRIKTRSAYTDGLPITTSQLSSLLRDKGFELNARLDNVTMRQYTATRDIAPPQNLSTVTGLGCSIQLVHFTIGDLEVNPIIFDSTRRATIKPSDLFKQNHGGVEVLSQLERDALVSLAERSPDAISSIVNNEQYYFTPYHYILDMGLRTFGARPYFMTSPKPDTRYVFQQNASLGLNIRSGNYGVEYTDTGYRISVTLEENSTLNVLTADQLTLQLSFVMADTQARGFINGELVSTIDSMTGRPIDDRWMYTFDIVSNFDIDQQHMFDVGGVDLRCGLVQEFDLVYIVKEYVPAGVMMTDIDVIIAKDKIPNYESGAEYYGATQEKLVITFGKYLDRLWSRTRTVVVEGEYQRYDRDIYEYWHTDIYERDASGHVVITIDPNTNMIVLNKIHSVGDPVLDNAGNHVIRYHKNDLILDQDNRPIPVKDIAELAREIDMFLVDGRYYFATEPTTTAYMDSSLNTIAGWIGNDLADAANRCLERTDIYFYPKMSSGMIDVIVGDGEMVHLKADQSIKVKYILRKEKFRNSEIRENLIKKTPSMLIEAFRSVQVANNGILTVGDIRSYVKNLVGGDVVDVRISGFLDDEFEAALSSDVSALPTLGKRLVPLSNLTLQVQDDVDVDFAVLDQDKIQPYKSY